MPSIRCEKCGHELTDNVVVCSACGANFTSEKIMSPSPDQSSKPRGLAKVIVVVVFFFSAAFLVVKFFQTSESDSASSKPTNDPIPDLQQTKTKADRGDAHAQHTLGKM